MGQFLTATLEVEQRRPEVSTPYTLHPTPYTLHSTPYTQNSAPYTLHPTPYSALIPKPETPKPESLKPEPLKQVGLLLTFTPGFAIKPGENVELFLPGFSGAVECFDVTPQPQTPNPKPRTSNPEPCTQTPKLPTLKPLNPEP